MPTLFIYGVFFELLTPKVIIAASFLIDIMIFFVQMYII